MSKIKMKKPLEYEWLSITLLPDEYVYFIHQKTDNRQLTTNGRRLIIYTFQPFFLYTPFSHDLPVYCATIAFVFSCLS
ncbi:MAG: hypothetical protein NUV74_16915 [Candidatus Brocadiaceae bacterium]|nr:hypothetical protein [Candidatus Brocadiaceae bacterium]